MRGGVPEFSKARGKESGHPPKTPREAEAVHGGYKRGTSAPTAADHGHVRADTTAQGTSRGNAIGKEEAEPMQTDGGALSAITTGAVPPTIAPDPLTGFVANARTILQGSQAPSEEQQKDLMQSLISLLAASPAQQAASTIPPATAAAQGQPGSDQENKTGIPTQCPTPADKTPDRPKPY